MAVFSTNQARQLYVHKTGADVATKAGYLEVVKNDKTNDIYIKSTNALGEPSRSDLINKDNILWISASTPGNERVPKKVVKVTLNPTVNEGNPIAGQDYILNINFRQYVGMSDTDIYIKQGFVRAYSGMEVSEFYTQLACSLFRNFMREPAALVKFVLTSGNTQKEVAAVKNNKTTGRPEAYAKNDTTGALEPITITADGLLITEAEQEWRLGVKSQESVYFDVYPTTVISDGDEFIWGVVEDKTPKKALDPSSKTIVWTPALNATNSYGNGKKIADLEYFCHGERGDMYRQIGWPHNLETAYLVDPTLNYYTITIHYAYVGSNESVQKSEKDIVLVTADNSKYTNILSNLPSDKLTKDGVKA